MAHCSFIAIKKNEYIATHRQSKSNKPDPNGNKLTPIKREAFFGFYVEIKGIFIN